MLNINAATAILYESFRLFRTEVKKNADDVFDFAAVSHPGVPSEVLKNSYLSALTIEKACLLNIFTKLKEQEPQRVLSPLAAKYFSKVFGKTINKEDVGLVKSSSTAFLDAITHLAASFQRDRNSMIDFVSNGPADQSNLYDTNTVILAPKGSFKCGALSPMSNACLFYLIDTKYDNNFKLKAADLQETIDKLLANNFKIGAFIFEAPSALGQCYEENEIRDIARVLDRYDKLLVVQDCYQLFTEHDKKQNSMLYNYMADPSRILTITSFRRKYGYAAQIMGISLIHTSNKKLLLNIMNRLTYLDRHPEKPLSFSYGQLRLTADTFAQMLDSDFPMLYCDLFGEFAGHFQDAVLKTNQTINERLGTTSKQYLYTLPTQAGQFGFLFIDNDTAKKAKIQNGLQFGELLAIAPECRILVTLLDPMGISYPIGVRFNLLTTNNNHRNLFLIKEALKGVANLIVKIENEEIDYNFYKPKIDQLYKLVSSF